MKNKKMCFDARMIRSSGIGTYIQEIMPRIADLIDFEIDVIIHEQDSEFASKIFDSPKINFIKCSLPIYSLKEQAVLPRIIDKRVDLLWVPHYNIPIFYSGKIMTTVHDVFHLAMPQFVRGIDKKLYAQGMFRLLKKKSQAILTVSNFSKREIERCTHYDSHRIFPIYNGVNSSWFQIEKKRNPHERPYFLFVGNIKPHKNLKVLLASFKKIMHHMPHDLVIVGKKSGFITQDNEIDQLADALGQRIIFTDYVDESVLKQYYAFAEALVFPSLYEGFGLPPLEAMASGCPVVSSDQASLPEVCGQAALYFDPYDEDSLAKQMIKICSEKRLRSELVEMGKKQARNFSWEKSSSDVLAVIEKILR